MFQPQYQMVVVSEIESGWRARDSDAAISRWWSGVDSNSRFRFCNSRTTAGCYRTIIESCRQEVQKRYCRFESTPLRHPSERCATRDRREAVLCGTRTLDLPLTIAVPAAAGLDSSRSARNDAIAFIEVFTRLVASAETGYGGFVHIPVRLFNSQLHTGLSRRTQAC